jgi:hypothetical protein
LAKGPNQVWTIDFKGCFRTSNGEIRWAGRKRFIGEAFIGHPAGLRQLGAGIYAARFAHLLIGHLHQKDPDAMRPALYQHGHHTLQKPKV